MQNWRHHMTHYTPCDVFFFFFCLSGDAEPHLSTVLLNSSPFSSSSFSSSSPLAGTNAWCGFKVSELHLRPWLLVIASHIAGKGMGMCVQRLGGWGKGECVQGGVREQPSTVSEDDTYNEEYSWYVILIIPLTPPWNLMLFDSPKQWWFVCARARVCLKLQASMSYSLTVCVTSGWSRNLNMFNVTFSNNMSSSLV